MEFTEEERVGLGVALNEAALLGFEVDPERRLAGATFQVFTLPQDGPVPEDRRVQVLLYPVGRIAASLRNGRWDDPAAEVVPFAVDELLAVVQSFGGQHIYGWEFIDVHEKALQEWGDRLSLDCSYGEGGRSHSITVFQDSGDRILDLCVWFDDILIRDPEGHIVPLDALIAGGRRWWDAFFAGDERTKGYGMGPLTGPAS